MGEAVTDEPAAKDTKVRAKTNGRTRKVRLVSNQLAVCDEEQHQSSGVAAAVSLCTHRIYATQIPGYFTRIPQLGSSHYLMVNSALLIEAHLKRQMALSGCKRVPPVRPGSCYFGHASG